MPPTSSQYRKRLRTTTSVLTALGLAASGVLAAGTAATAAPARTATTSVDSTYLQDTLGVGDNTVIETVTYDRFQWLLQQPGQFAFLIGSQADPNFKDQAKQADAAARAAGAAKLYWFDPNLTGVSGDRNLDVRNPDGIKLAAGSQQIYGRIWTNVLGQYLGNGLKSVPNGASVTVTSDDSVVNDAVNPAFDKRTGETAALGAADNAVILYDKDHTAEGGAADKIVDWVNLNGATDQRLGEAFTAIGGGAVIDQLSQFKWWEDSANKKHRASYSDENRYGGDILTDSDEADGWRVKQITYPELRHLLDIKADGANFALLFGGTWCHNTRAVLKDVNAQAQENDVATVYNFDLVLDGGTVNGTNGGSNPIHVRDNANSGSTFNFRPSYVYGDVVRTYFKNLVTEYDPNSGTSVSYYPGGDLTAFPSVVRKLQVPFVLNYERGTGTNPSSTAVKRQWIQQNVADSTGLASFKEYMSEWWFTHPSNQLGLNFEIAKIDEFPPGTPEEQKPALLAARLTQLDQARSNVKFAAEAIDRLGYFFGGLPGGVVSKQTVTAPAVTYGSAGKITVAVTNAYGRIPTGDVTLTIKGASQSAKLLQNSAAFTTAKLEPGKYPFVLSYAGDTQIQAFEKTGTLTVAKAKATVKSAAKTAPTAARSGSYAVTVTAPKGLKTATGTVTITLTKGKTKVVAKAALKSGKATVAVKKLAAGKWKVVTSYSGDARYNSGNAATASLAVK